MARILTDMDPTLRYDEQPLTDEQKAQARANIGAVSNNDIIADADRHAEYFTITDDGIISLKPEYRGACPEKRVSTIPFAVSDNGAEVAGSKNAELPQSLVIPQIVDEIAVVSLAEGMFLYNHAVESITLPDTVTEIPYIFCNNAYKIANVYNTERITSIGIGAFQRTPIKKASFPNLTSLGEASFCYCPFLVFADIGKVTSVEANTFFMCTRLSRLKGGADVITIGAGAFAKTYRLYNVESLAKVTSIGQDAFMRSRLNYDWGSLTDCTYGENATALQMNPTDFWSACEFTPSENPVPTLLSQADLRWTTDILTGDIEYGLACGWMAIMHIYCALNNLTLTSVKEFEDICNAIDTGIIGKYNKRNTTTAEIFTDLGLKAEAVAITNSNAQETLQKFYDALANGGYVWAYLDYASDGATGEGLFGAHAAMIYGVNANGELLYADSSDLAASVMTEGRSTIKYPMPFQNTINIRDTTAKPFVIVTKA